MIQLQNISPFRVEIRPEKKAKLIKPVENTEKGVNVKEKNNKDGVDYYA